MQKVLRGSSTSLCNILKRRSKVCPFGRSLSKAAVPTDEEEGLPKQVPTNPEPLFGIAPRKLRNEEDDDFYPTTAPGPTSFSEDNYFSKAWAAQKQTPLSKSGELMSDQDPEQVTLQCASTTLKVFPVRERLPKRVWLCARDLQPSIQETFTFASLKVLSTAIAWQHRLQLYGYVPKSVLDWKTRRKRIVAELDMCYADIICLQEVDRFEDLNSDLSKRGYEGLYKVSTGRAYDGCVIFWSKNRFKLLYEKALEFNKLGLRDNVAQLCVFQLLSPGSSTEATPDLRDAHVGRSKHLIVGNIDLLFNPKRGEIKLGQCRAFLKEVDELSRAWPGAPVVIGGCFQFTPQSALYKFMAESELDLFGFRRETLSGQLQQKRGKVTENLGAYDLASGDGMDSLNARLRKSLIAAFAVQRQGRQGADFAALAKEMLSIPPDADGSVPSSKAAGAGQSPKEGYNRGPELVSKTIEILKSSVSTQRVDNSPITPDSVPNTTMESNEAMEEACCSTKDMESDITSRTDRSSNTGEESTTQKQGVDAEELKIATRSEDSTMDRPDTRDDKGEPIVTVYTRGPELVSKTIEILKSSVPAQRADKSPTSPDSVCHTTIESSEAMKEFCSGGKCTKVVEPDSTGIVGGNSSTGGESSTQKQGWNVEELKIATGSEDATMVKHELKLFSVYPEIQGRRDTRDDKGEPLVTMYHNDFRGTVDYIWRSEGLKTAKVLDSVPLQDVLALRGLPSRVYGSDHVSIACELAFVS